MVVFSTSFLLSSLLIDTHIYRGMVRRLVQPRLTECPVWLPQCVIMLSYHDIYESDDSSLVHMDVDQSFLPITTPVKAAIFESFARQTITESETDAGYSFPSDSNTKFIYAGSAVALFTKLVNCCVQEGGTLSLCTVTIPTSPELGYKLNFGGTREKLSSANPALCVCLLGGLLFKMLTSGLKFGFLLLNQPSVVDTVKKLLDLGERETWICRAP